MNEDALREAASQWAKRYPHRRWFLDYYRLSPRDPSYLSMTDEEILFDFLTVQETRTAEVERMAEEPQEGNSPVSVLPDSPLDQNRSSSMQVSADRAEFIRWYEQEVGPWQTPR